MRHIQAPLYWTAWRLNVSVLRKSETAVVIVMTHYTEPAFRSFSLQKNA